MPKPRCVPRTPRLGSLAEIEVGSEETAKERVGGLQTEEKEKGRKANGGTKTRTRKGKKEKERMCGRNPWTKANKQQSRARGVQAAFKPF